MSETNTDDEISVVFPSPREPHEPITDLVARHEFLTRMDGTGAADQLKSAGRRVRVVALMEVEALTRWLATRPSRPDEGVDEATR